MRTAKAGRCQGRMRDPFSVSADLDCAGVSPIPCHLRDLGRVRFESATCAEAVNVFPRVGRRRARQDSVA